MTTINETISAIPGFDSGSRHGQAAWSRILAGLAARVRAAHQRRATAVSLREVDAHILRDIGLERAPRGRITQTDMLR